MDKMRLSEQSLSAQGAALRPYSIREDLEARLKHHQTQIEKIHRAIALMTQHPEMEEFTNLMREL